MLAQEKEMPPRSTFGFNYYVFKVNGNSPKRTSVNHQLIASGIAWGIFLYLVNIHGKQVIQVVYL